MTTDWTTDPEAAQARAEAAWRIAEAVRRHAWPCRWCLVPLVMVDAHGHKKRFEAERLSDLMLDDRGRLCLEPGSMRQAHHCDHPPMTHDGRRNPAEWADSYVGPPDPGFFGHPWT